jgi:serine/threonine-protein kinase
MTRTTTVMGSPLYMSPEQMESSKGVDPRADIWALGVILYELVCGKVPFHGEAITELVLRIVTMNPTPMPMARPDVPEGLERTILRCLEKNRENRFSNVGELAAALIEFSPKSRLSLERIRGVMLAAGISATPSAAPPPPPATTQSSQQGTTHQQTAASWGQTGGNAAGAGTLGRVPRAVIGISAVGAVLAVTLILVLARKGPASAPSAAAPVPPAVAAASSPTASPVAPPPAAAPVPVAAGPGSPSPADSGAPAPSPVSAPAPAAAASPAKNAGSHPHAAASAAPAAPAPAKTGAKPNCDPPYFMDASGHRQYKPECF